MTSGFEAGDCERTVRAIDLLNRTVRRQDVDNGLRYGTSDLIDDRSADETRRQFKIELCGAVFVRLDTNPVQRLLDHWLFCLDLDLVPYAVFRLWQPCC